MTTAASGADAGAASSSQPEVFTGSMSETLRSATKFARKRNGSRRCFASSVG